MDWHLSRSPDVLWCYIHALQEDPDCSLFYDLSIYCRDGVLLWNRLCLATSLPSCVPILTKDIPESETALSLPDYSVTELKEQLLASITSVQSSPDDKVSYNLVEHIEEPKEPLENGIAEHEDSPYCEIVTSPRQKIDGRTKQGRLLRKRQTTRRSGSYSESEADIQSLKKPRRCPSEQIDYSEIKVEPEASEQKTAKKISGRKKKKRVSFYEEDDDFDVAMAMAIGGDIKKESAVVTSRLSRTSEKPEINGKARVQNCNGDLSEKLAPISTRLRNVAKVEKVEDDVADVKEEAVEQEPRVVVDASHGTPESEDVEEKITRYLVSGKIIKECNACGYSTERADKVVMREHLFSHFPDICGFACLICRKAAKRKRDLILHLERGHTAEVLKLFGIEYMKQYEVNFDTNSEEQVKLRNEEYCPTECSNCKQTYYSAARLNLHIDMGLCQFSEQRKKVERVQKNTFKGDNFEEERKKFDILMDSDSDGSGGRGGNRSSDDEDFNPRDARCTPGPHIQVEQLSLNADVEGLLQSLEGGPPYYCVIPSCQQKVYYSKPSIKRHYISHDPDMVSKLVCPICKITKPEDQPAAMTKHIVMEHEKDDEWATENVIVDVSERLQWFRNATMRGRGRGRPRGSGRGRGRPPLHRGWPGRDSEQMQRRGLGSYRCKKCPISMDDPLIKASFESGGEHTDTGPQWNCGVPECNETFRLAYQLKRHYWKHDKTLYKALLECKSCSYSTHLLRMMESHLQNEHPDTLFLAESRDTQYSSVEGKKWQEFSERANALIEANPNHNGRDCDRREEKAAFDTIEATCQVCSETFNTQNSFEDHEKVHKPELIKFKCQQCSEGFIVESVFKNHIKSHQILYTSLKSGPIRCNGCSQHFAKVAEVKRHLSVHHMNLLENCHFCEQCTDFFTFKHSLRNHMFTHAKEVFRCPVCPAKQFHTQREADEHIAKNKCKAKELNHVCTDCGRRFISNSLLDVHIRKVHQNIFQYQCNVCHCLYENIPLMERHIRKSHKVAEGPIMEYFTFHTLEEAKLLDVERLNANKPKGRRGERSSEKFSCPFGCGGSFKKSGLTRHKKVCQRSTDEYKVEVNDGAEIDKQVSELMVPGTDPSTGKVLWKCTQCDYSNKLRFTVKEHVETHISGVTHKCPLCPKTCPTRNALRVHTIRNHPSPNAKLTLTPIAPKKNPEANQQQTNDSKIEVMKNGVDQNHQPPINSNAVMEVNNSTAIDATKKQANEDPQYHKLKTPKEEEFLLQQQQKQDSSQLQQQQLKLKQPPLLDHPPRSEDQLRPPSAHMGHFNQGLLNHHHHHMLNHPLMSPSMMGHPPPGRGYYDDTSSQHSEDNSSLYNEESNRLLQHDIHRHHSVHQDNSRHNNTQNPPYGIPGYGFPIWHFYRQ